MARITPTPSAPTGGKKYTWANLVPGDYGASVEIPYLGDRTIQVTGTIGTGSPAYTIYGSNLDAAVDTDPTSVSPKLWEPLTDPNGNAMTKTALSGEQILENYQYFTVAVTGGTGTSLTFTLLSKGNK